MLSGTTGLLIESGSRIFKITYKINETQNKRSELQASDMIEV